MCLILYKSSNVPFNEEKIKEFLENSCITNKDGKGFAINCKEYVAVRKGFETVNEMMKAVKKFKNLDDREIVFHLRNPSPNTEISTRTVHPIVADEEENEKKSVNTINPVILHNGAFREFTYYNHLHAQEPSDTVAFANKYLNPKQTHSYEFLQYYKANYSSKFDDFVGNNNKFVIMKAGSKSIIHGFMHSEGGLKLSNTSFRKTTYSHPTTYCSTHRTTNHNAFNNKSPTSDRALNYYERKIENYIISRSTSPLDGKLAIRSNLPFCCSNSKNSQKVCDKIKMQKKESFCCKHVSKEILEKRIAVKEFIDKKVYWNKAALSDIGFRFSDFECSFFDIIRGEKDAELRFYYSECSSCYNKENSNEETYKYCSICNGLGMQLRIRTRDKKNTSVYSVNSVRSENKMNSFNVALVIGKIINAAIAHSKRSSVKLGE